MDDVILVDENDNIIRNINKLDAHLSGDYLHRAFSCFIINSNNEVYIQKRAQNKLLWPGYWSNSYCSHPRPNEDISHAVLRRAEEELGIVTNEEPIFLYKFQYKEKYEDIGYEHELCHVFIVFTDTLPRENPEEVSAGLFIKIECIQEYINNNKYLCTPWFRKEWEEILQNHSDKLFQPSCECSS
ncbi:isopentenyl-diphosphate Delta-isomerase [Vibrio spartinae]|uniref:Isopentenyl-diphosphate Delta-isomerase n=1 Tax=Vibrio spartinae TaxID=1918945 RepID=A0A1N6M8G0_9VIBR|nr:isopentenyl-diphosphate Delta-isomerase [Vibrio spartinae]SIO95743.1 Isopentenyl-diphosphate Delta-isomerase [Vibrio spartinae]